MNLSFPVDSALHPRNRRSVQAGFGLLQVMLVLLLVGAALAAGAVLLQAKRAPQQAITQEQTLRWADEAIAAFAAANARLPCPADIANGEENCASGNAKGWLPARTLLGASGSGMRIGPVAYMVYRGDASAHLDLTAPGNTYQPPLTDGSPRKIVIKDKKGEPTDDTRQFEAINGLDLCRTLELVQALPHDPAKAGTAGVPWNVAYGIAAAGPQSGQSRLDDANTGSTQMAAPWQEWDSGYDDRVRVRTFDGAGQMLGCRLLGGAAPAPVARAYAAPLGLPGAAAATATPYNVSLAGMDVLAAAVTLHDALGELQASNMDATESALQGAVAAQISVIFKLVTTAVSLSDNITTLITSSVSLVRSIVTCIASLGATCAEVPLKTAAVVTSIVGLGAKGVTLAQKAASLPLVTAALAATIKARDLAKKSEIPPVSNPDEARRQLECTLWARNCTSDEGVVKTELNPDWKDGDDPKDKYRIVYRHDDSGNLIPKLDADGNPMHDSSGNPLYEPEYEAGAPRKGLEDETLEAEKNWKVLLKQVDALEEWRLAPWGVGVANNGDLTENGRIVERIDVEMTRTQICGGNWKNCRYGKAQVRVECPYVGANKGEYVLNGSDCAYVGTETITEPDPNDSNKTVTVTRGKGDRDRVEITEYVYNQDQAVVDAIALRTFAQGWSSLRMRKEELDKEIKLREDNFKSWFDRGGILSKMEAQRDDNQHCGARPTTAMTQQKCENAKLTVLYIDTCQKPEPKRVCTALSPGTGRYRDADCTDRSGSDAEKDYGWVETLQPPPYPQDKEPDAVCRPNMQSRINALKDEQGRLQQDMDSARNAYNERISRKEAPWLTYPTGPSYNWFEWAIQTTEKADGTIQYDWARTPVIETYSYDEQYDCSYPEDHGYWVEATETTGRYWHPVIVTIPKTCTRKANGTRSLPWYAREPFDASPNTQPPLMITNKVKVLGKELQLYELMPPELCKYFGGGRKVNDMFWVWPTGSWWGNTADWWGKDIYPMGLYCQRYPYSRAFEDWKRAKLGASNAEKHYKDLSDQYEKLKQEYEDMRSGNANGGDEIPMAFGAEPALEWADSRGSAGPQPLVQP
ncbi:hypothetical protein [Stenotrophomonas sp. PS02297]|uniref:hypothetical protein n=1 Tax=Stenotrophomonas sp. PS02297 TaxID=2991423 RepID=UPI00249B9E32|nr:hypothetical protein [Stenotrophomonas sp. PS02297]